MSFKGSSPEQHPVSNGGKETVNEKTQPMAKVVPARRPGFLNLQEKPLFLLMLVLAVIAVGEYGVMVFLERFAPSFTHNDALIDAMAITLLMFPVLLVLVFRPLQRQIARRRETERTLRKTIDALNETAEQVRYLRGLLPICASCKRIRDVNGHWTQIEQYIAANSEASFTHSICADCSLEFYPGLGANRDQRRALGGGR